MARAYTIATAALALSVEIKWLDNILSRYDVTGVSQSRQGVSRRISRDGMVELTIVKNLTEGMRVPVELALERARVLAASGEWLLEGGIEIRLDRARMLSDLERQLEYAVEGSPIPRRGRPPGKTKRGAD